MSEGTELTTNVNERPIGKNPRRLLYLIYLVMLGTSVVILLAGIFKGSFLRVFVIVPVTLILASAILVDKKALRMPPLMIFILVTLMVIVTSGMFIFNAGTAWMSLIDFIFGILLGFCGLIMTYSFVTLIFDIYGDRSKKASLVSASLALSIYILWLVIQYYFGIYVDDAANGFTAIIKDMDRLMNQMMFIIAGILLISAIFHFGRKSSAVRLLTTKYSLLGTALLDVESKERGGIRKAIENGESETVEFKSTLRTSLTTGERDEKIERAVLKTLVAFLNSRGGMLLIGIEDNGNVIGIDKSFKNRDKAGLHLTNLITTHIGNEFLPYISFKVIDYNGK